MPHFSAIHQPPTTPISKFDPLDEFHEDVSGLFKDGSTAPAPLPSTVSQRQKYFQTEAHRKAVEFTPNVSQHARSRPPGDHADSIPFDLPLQTVLHVDFAYGYFQFPELYLTLPGGISFDLKRYWRLVPRTALPTRSRT